MKDSSIIGVALAKERCPVCGKDFDGPIIMNSVLTEKRAKEVEALNGKVIGMANKPCHECQVMIDQGIVIIEIDGTKCQESGPEGPYRTGMMFCMTEEAFKRIFNELPPERICYMTDDFTKKLGLHGSI